MCVPLHTTAGDQETQKRLLGPLELELQVAVTSPVWFHVGTRNQIQVLCKSNNFS